MALTPENLGFLYTPDPPPLGGSVEQLTAWVYSELGKVAQFMRRPEVPGIVFSRIDFAADPDFKAQDGLMLFVGPGVLGPQEGLYIRESGIWKKIAGT